MSTWKEMCKRVEVGALRGVAIDVTTIKAIQMSSHAIVWPCNYFIPFDGVALSTRGANDVRECPETLDMSATIAIR